MDATERNRTHEAGRATETRAIGREPVSPHERADGYGARARDPRPIGTLIREMLNDITLLLRQEVALAKAEMGEKLAKFARNGAYLGAGALIAFCGFVVLLFAATAGLYAAFVAAEMDNMLAGWLAPLIVGGLVLLLGGGLVAKAISTFKNESLAPRKTTQSLRETKEWMKDKIA